MSRTRKLAWLAVDGLGLLAAAIVLTAAWPALAPVLQRFFGFCNGCGNGSHYLFWSGSGSDFSEAGILWGVLLYYRNTNCKRSWCPFLGHHEFTDPLDGVTRKLCWYHHPDVKHKTLRPRHIAVIQERRAQAWEPVQNGDGSNETTTQ